jgi:hypothetical protein
LNPLAELEERKKNTTQKALQSGILINFIDTAARRLHGQFARGLAGLKVDI